MRILSFNLCLLLVCVYRNAYAAGRLRLGPLWGDGINFPRRTLTKTQAANFVFNKRLFSIYRIANPPFGTDIARDLELVYRPGTHGSIYESWDARFRGVCARDVWLFECMQGEGNRAVFTFEGPFPTTGKGITISFFSSHPWNYVFQFVCLDRTKEIVRYGKRVFCDGPWTVILLTYEFPPYGVKWYAAEHDLWKTLRLTFDHASIRFEPTFKRCSRVPLLPY